jgi:Transglycosylase SLT domain
VSTALGVGGLLAAVLIAALGGSVSGAAAGVASAAAPAASPFALADIPGRYLALYESAAARYGLDWTILAAIGRVECDHGRDPDPSCTSPGAVNRAGAGGPVQFIASTWARFGIDGDGDGSVSRWDPADAIFSAANYLHASGAPADYRAAVLAYNDSQAYLGAVESWARRYRGARVGAVSAEAGAQTPFAGATYVAGERALLEPGDGHVALVPSESPKVVQAMVIAGNELQDLPYGPGGHPDPRGAAEEDCSSTVNYLLYRAGIRPISEIVSDNPLAQDYVTWGAPGPGRWVTIYATDSPTPHVFAVVAGLRIDTSHNGTDVGPNRAEDGPRWRILDHIPEWAHWSVRHPPGL